MIPDFIEAWSRLDPVELAVFLREDGIYHNDAARGGGNPNHDISLDGQQFIFVEQDSSGTPPQITVVLNWPQERLERVPVP